MAALKTKLNGLKREPPQGLEQGSFRSQVYGVMKKMLSTVVLNIIRATIQQLILRSDRLPAVLRQILFNLSMALVGMYYY